MRQKVDGYVFFMRQSYIATTDVESLTLYDYLSDPMVQQRENERRQQETQTAIATQSFVQSMKHLQTQNQLNRIERRVGGALF
jgi:hypothetical protein